MNLPKLASGAIFVFAIASTSAMAQSNAKKDQLYGELGYTNANYSEVYSGSTYTWSSVTAYRVIIGADLDDNIAIEGMYASGISNGSLTISGYSTSVSLGSSYGFYAKPKLNLNDNATLFARVGFAQTKGTASIPGLGWSNTASNSSLSYGLGGSYKINEKMSLNADYMVYYNSSAAAINGVTFGIGYRF